MAWFKTDTVASITSSLSSMVDRLDALTAKIAEEKHKVWEQIIELENKEEELEAEQEKAFKVRDKIASLLD